MRPAIAGLHFSGLACASSYLGIILLLVLVLVVLLLLLMVLLNVVPLLLLVLVLIYLKHAPSVGDSDSTCIRNTPPRLAMPDHQMSNHTPSSGDAVSSYIINCPLIWRFRFNIYLKRRGRPPICKQSARIMGFKKDSYALKQACAAQRSGEV